MKKTLLSLVVAMLAGLTGFAQITDTIVSLTPSNRNVLIEEYTGIGCQYCPDGHRIANEIHDAHPDRVCIINIHQGSYASNTYTTEFGNALAAQIGLSGYPAGTVNRHLFSQYSNVLDVYRDYWPNCANSIMNTPSPVNIAAEGTYDWATGLVTIRVQLYYTGSQSVSTNALNVAILQDSVMGTQSGASYNPSQVVGNQYRHMHMLRHLITGQWGETIETITPGTLVEKVYTYVIPGVLGSPNPIAAVPKDLSFVAFVTEGQKEVLTACEVEMVNNAPEKLAKVGEFVPVTNVRCDDEIDGKLTIANYGRVTLSSVNLEYGLDGTALGVVEWSGSLAPGATTTMYLPTLHVNLGADVELSAKVVSIDGEEVEGSENTYQIRKNVYSAGGYMTFILTTDAFGSEIRFRFYDPNNAVVLKGGPWSNVNSPATVRHDFAFTPTTTGCYRLEVFDSYGDGINCGYGQGYFELLDSEGNVIFHNNGNIGKKTTYMIDVTAPVGVDVYQAESTIYPNPATDVVNINTPDNVQRVEIFNMQGQLVKMEAGEVYNISVKEFATGIYTMKLTTDKGVSMHKIVKK